MYLLNVILVRVYFIFKMVKYVFTESFKVV